MSTQLLDQALVAFLQSVEGVLILLSTVPPEAFWAGAGLLSAGLLAILWGIARRAARGARAWLATRSLRTRTRSSGRAPRARALAARGTSRVEIARVTGLSRDVLALLLRAADHDAGADERPNLPRTARFAA